MLNRSTYLFALIASYAFLSLAVHASCDCDRDNIVCLDKCINEARSCMVKCDKHEDEDNKDDCYSVCFDAYWPNLAIRSASVSASSKSTTTPSASHKAAEDSLTRSGSAYSQLTPTVTGDYSLAQSSESLTGNTVFTTTTSQLTVAPGGEPSALSGVSDIALTSSSETQHNSYFATTMVVLLAAILTAALLA